LFAADAGVAMADHASRLAAVRDDLDADALVLGPGPDCHYCTGFYGEPGDRHALFVASRDGAPAFVAPAAHVEQVRAICDRFPVRAVAANEPATVARVAAEALADAGGVPDAPTLAIDDALPFAATRVLEAALPADSVLESASHALDPHRLAKDESERAAVRRAAGVADAVSEAVRSGTLVGRTEADVAREVRAGLHERGSVGVPFPVVVASGPNAAQPWYRHGDREIAAGDPVVLDFGAVVDRYASDQTRTVVAGHADPPDEFAAVHDAVRAALDAGIEAVEPGVEAGAVDAAARDVLRERGYADAFTHDTGHGVGLEAHEAPVVGPGSETVLEPGVVLTVEPGVYLEGRFGVRVEELVCVTETGCEVLSGSVEGEEAR